MNLVIIANKDFESGTLLEEAVKYAKINFGELKEVAYPDDKSKFSKLVQAKFKRFKTIPYPIEWDNLDREGSVEKTNNWGKKYNSKAAIFRDDDLLNYGFDNQSMFLIIDENREFSKYVKKIEEYGSLCIMFNPRNTPEHEAKVIYRL